MIGPCGFDSLTAFVEGNRQGQGTEFADAYRKAAMQALDTVEASLVSGGKGKTEASATLSDLTTSLHAIRDVAVRTRDSNMQAVKRAAAESPEVGTFSLGNVQRPLADGGVVRDNKLIRPDCPEVRGDPVLPTGYEHHEVVAAALTYSREYVVVHEKEGRDWVGTLPYNNMERTLKLADEVGPFVRTIFAHPAFADQEKVDVQESTADTHNSITTLERSGFIHHREAVVSDSSDTHTHTVKVDPTPILQDAMSKLQELRGLISAMRPMPGSRVNVVVQRTLSEDALVRTNPRFGSATEEHVAPSIAWTMYEGRPCRSDGDVTETRARYSFPAAPDYVWMS